jgi:hypothetical protein
MDNKLLNKWVPILKCLDIDPLNYTKLSQFCETYTIKRSEEIVPTGDSLHLNSVGVPTNVEGANLNLLAMCIKTLSKLDNLDHIIFTNFISDFETLETKIVWSVGEIYMMTGIDMIESQAMEEISKFLSKENFKDNEKILITSPIDACTIVKSDSNQPLGFKYLTRFKKINIDYSTSQTVIDTKEQA